MGPESLWLALTRRGYVDTNTQEGKTMGRHREKTAIYKPRREAWNKFVLHSPQKIATLWTP